MEASCAIPAASIVEDSAKKMGKFVFPAGFPEDRRKILNRAVNLAIIALSTVRRKNCNDAAALSKKIQTIRERQSEVDEFLRQKTVQEVNNHTTKETDRVIERIDRLEEVLVSRKRKAPSPSSSTSLAPTESSAAAPASNEVVESAEDPGGFGCEHCGFKSATHRGLATHLSRSHTAVGSHSKKIRLCNVEVMKEIGKNKDFKFWQKEKYLLFFVMYIEVNEETCGGSAFREALMKFIPCCKIFLEKLKEKFNGFEDPQSVLKQIWKKVSQQLPENASPSTATSLYMKEIDAFVDNGFRVFEGVVKSESSD